MATIASGTADASGNFSIGPVTLSQGAKTVYLKANGVLVGTRNFTVGAASQSYSENFDAVIGAPVYNGSVQYHAGDIVFVGAISYECILTPPGPGFTTANDTYWRLYRPAGWDIGGGWNVSPAGVAAGNTHGLYNGATFAANQYSSAKVGSGGTAIHTNPGPLVRGTRVTTAIVTGYYLLNTQSIYDDGENPIVYTSAPTFWRQESGGLWNQIGNPFYPVDAGVQVNFLRIEATGTSTVTLTGYYKQAAGDPWTLIGAVNTSTTPYTSGYPGIWYNWCDDWQGGDL